MSRPGPHPFPGAPSWPTVADRPHPPSQARAIAQAAKQGGDFTQLAQEAGRIADSYHAAWALAHVVADAGFAPDRAAKFLAEVSVHARRVPEPWRRAELVAELGKILLGGVSDPTLAEPARRMLLDLLPVVEPGKALSAAVQGLAPRMARASFAELLSASRRGGEILEDGKALVAGWVQAGAARPAETERLRSVIASLGDAALESRLWGHLHLQAARARLALPYPPLDEALAATRRIPEPADRVEVLRVLAAEAADMAELGRIGTAAPDEPATRARLLSALAAQADRLRDKVTSARWFQEAAAAADAVSDAKARSALRRNLAQGLRRLGDAEAADRLQALADADRGAAPATRAEAPPETPAPSPPDASPTPPAPAPRPGRRPILALHNAYDGGLGKPHVQAVARAAPLAIGYGFDLALVGFPTTDAADLVRRVEADTGVGEGRGLATQLLAEGRILLVGREHHGQPHRWGIADAYVATTQEPNPAKPADLVALLGKGRVCLIMGLGSRGLPKQLLDAAPFHLELTGAGVPLETATAMGALAERIGALLRR